MMTIEISESTPIFQLTVGQFMTIFEREQNQTSQTKQETPIPEIYGVEKLQQITGYSKATIYAKTSKNEIPQFKRDGRLFFRHADIIEWMTANRIETKEEVARNLDRKLTKRKGNAK
ncbi:MAG: helix-turn-helix domain-containing protein [Ignavibacteria bacterium]|nr:helix-turn-helix domain-containing protein [Ignavibacteria bacterium]